MTTRFGPYRVVRPLGHGGMGVVYRAEHVDTGESVALKTVTAPDAGELEALRREIHALRRVDHPGVVRIVAVGVVEGRPWYAMELLEGDTLRSYKRRLAGGGAAGEPYEFPTVVRPRSVPPPAGDTGETEEPAPSTVPPVSRATAFTRAAGGDLPRLLTLIRGVCEALAFVHGLGLVHRDLKPDNVFLRDGGPGLPPTPVLVDFGLAVSIAGARAHDRYEPGGKLAGSPAYMAPEQIEDAFVDARADLYALGVMLYESVTGTVPFVGSVRQVLAQHLRTLPMPPSGCVVGVPPGLDDLVLHLLQKRPRDRPGYAADVAAALARLGAAPGGPAPRGAPVSLSARARRARGGDGGAGAGHRTRPPLARRPRADRRRERRGQDPLRHGGSGGGGAARAAGGDR